MKQYHYPIVLALLGTLCFADSNTTSHREIQSLYDGAKEMEMLNRSMERGMQLHNQTLTQPIETEINEETMLSGENNTIPGFKEESDHFYYEEIIPNYQNTKVEINTEGNTVIISTKTTQKEEKEEANGMNVVKSTSSSKMELTLPYNADMNTVQKSYEDGLVQITVSKKPEFIDK